MQRRRLYIITSMILATCYACAQADVHDSLIMLNKESFNVLYDYSRLCPAVVWWPLSRSDIRGSARQKSNYFYPDASLPRPRAMTKWFNKSGYQRGHICPSADRRNSQQRQASTFTMSNIAPMTPFLNQRAWYNLEVATRQVLRSYQTVTVVAGCLWSVPVSSSSRVQLISVPDTFFRIVYIPPDSNKTIYWLVPQNAIIDEEKRYRVSRKRFRDTMSNRFTKYFQKW